MFDNRWFKSAPDRSVRYGVVAGHYCVSQSSHPPEVARRATCPRDLEATRAAQRDLRHL